MVFNPTVRIRATTTVTNTKSRVFPGSEHDAEVIPHGGNYDDACQYLLASGDIIREKWAEVLYSLEPKPDTVDSDYRDGWPVIGSPAPAEALPPPGMPPNPKQIFGDKKPPLDEFPLTALTEACLAHFDGDLKYGFRNWLDLPVEARTYIKGALRHLQLWANGEERARDGVHNLGHAIAGLAILIDAQANGMLIDNRRKSQAACDRLHDAEADVAMLKDMHATRQAAANKSAPPAPAPSPPAGTDTTERPEPVRLEVSIRPGPPIPLSDEKAVNLIFDTEPAHAPPPELPSAPADVPRRELPPIPEGVTFDPEGEDDPEQGCFFRGNTNIDSSGGYTERGPLFWATWKDRWQEFPRYSPVVLAS